MNPVLHSRILGSGRPLVILHGFLGMSDNWKALGNAYADHGFQVHLVDQRNHGKSFWSPDFDYGLMARDLNTYLAHHQLRKVALIGHSMGGKTAMRFACDHAERTDRLLVADIAPKYYPPHHHDILNALTALDLKTISSRNEADKQLAAFIADVGTRQFLLKNLYWEQKGKLAFRFNLEILRQKMEEIGGALDPLSHFNGPTLFLNGARSSYVLASDTPLIQKHFPDALVGVVDNAGHWLHAENPKQFLERSLAFLEPV